MNLSPAFPLADLTNIYRRFNVHKKQLPVTVYYVTDQIIVVSSNPAGRRPRGVARDVVSNSLVD